MINTTKINCLTIVRADDEKKMACALSDMVKYAHLSFSDDVRVLDPSVADDALVKIMKVPLRRSCNTACIVPLNESPNTAIGRIKTIHPPCHIIVVSARYEVFYQLVYQIEDLPKFVLKDEYKDYNDDEILFVPKEI